ncbi:hypothetical protein Q7C36_005128 [Tachysurus vachellii]|uniref:Secreted protein n=1 Tax=Tachysurus vachellii TaxID=175792 RepID=A0AA88NXZ4_TACVA|nr:hypothetical protein Q7C36_005128 [Tachysurus vachellii]
MKLNYFLGSLLVMLCIVGVFASDTMLYKNQQSQGQSYRYFELRASKQLTMPNQSCKIPFNQRQDHML